MDWDTRFGAFRQLLHTGASSPHDRAQLLDLIDDVFHTDPDRYLEQWVGYAASLHLDAPVVIECASVSAFFFWSERAPFARFDVSFDEDLRGAAAVKTLATSPRLGLVRALSTAQSRLGPKGAQVLAALDGLVNLEVLDLSSSYIKDEGFEALVDSGLLDGLTHLDLYSCALDVGSAERMANDVDTTALVTLDLSSNPFGPDGVIAIVASCPQLRELLLRVTVDDDPCVFVAQELEHLVALESLSNLEALHIPFSYLPDSNALECIRVLTRARHFEKLTHLEIDGLYGSLDAAAAVTLLDSEALPALMNLSQEFFRTINTREDCDALLAHPRAQAISHLDISHDARPFVDALSDAAPLDALRSISIHDVTCDDLDALATWRGLSQVQALDLSNSAYELVDTDLANLIASPHTRGLRELHLPRRINLIEVPEMLAGSPALDGLEVLSFQRSYINDVGSLRALCSSAELTSLRRLEMRDCEMHAEELDVICSCAHFSSLRELDLRDEDLGPRHLDALRQLPCFDGLDVLGLMVPLPWRMKGRGDTRDTLPPAHLAMLERAEALVSSLADGPLPRNLDLLDVRVLDYDDEPLVPDALLRLIARPELSHNARHELLAPLKKKQLNALAKSAGLKGATRLKRYPLIEAIRRFVVARDAASA